MAMDAERKAQWLTMLRSGEYEQGQNKLKSSDDEYCCLGVACEAALEAGVVDYWEHHHSGYNTDRVYGDREAWEADRMGVGGSWSGLPQKAMDWLGLEDGDPFVTVPVDHPRFHLVEQLEGSPRARLSTLNDNGFTFDEIADLIEAQL